MRVNIDEKEHPFPTKEMLLMKKIEQCLDKEDFEVICNLLHKYLNLRADVFHDY